MSGCGWSQASDHAATRWNLLSEFSLKAFLEDAGAGKVILPLRKGREIFTQGERSDSVFYVQQGRLKLSVVSDRGREATVAVLSPGDFAGEECLSNVQQVRSATAFALTDCVLLRINKALMVRMIHEETALAELFIAYLLARGERAQADLVDHFLNQSEKRLARILLLLANFPQAERSEMLVPKISQEALAAMVGCTRSRVNHLLNRFRRLGFIDYQEQIRVNETLVRVISQN